jgi:tetratricopeptide (TPR) repeat protein
LAGSRIEKLRSFMAARPADPFPRYALALEHRNGGDHAAAWAAFEELLAAHPTYCAAYLHAGNALVALGRTDEARSIWRNGVEVCGKQGDSHARGELESALAATPAR